MYNWYYIQQVNRIITPQLSLHSINAELLQNIANPIEIESNFKKTGIWMFLFFYLNEKVWDLKILLKFE